MPPLRPRTSSKRENLENEGHDQSLFVGATRSQTVQSRQQYSTTVPKTAVERPMTATLGAGYKKGGPSHDTLCYS